jgi:hypothetical protein
MRGTSFVAQNQAIHGTGTTHCSETETAATVTTRTGT